MLPSNFWRSLVSWTFGVILLALVLFYALQAIVAGSTRPVTVVVYAFSTQEEVLTQGIFPAFERQWETETGRALTIEAVFGPSGTLARQIVLGAPADVALFSHEQHVTWLKAAQLVDRQTQSSPVCYTPMVIVTRPGNPAGLAAFSDLVQPGLRLLHPDPRSSGAGEWALLAEYGSILLETDRPELAQGQLRSIWQNVRLLTPSARTTLTVFELGAGDVFITYEQDARLALERGVPLEIVVPARTILAQNRVVTVDANVTTAEAAAVQALVDYMTGPQGQAEFARFHFRPAKLPPPDGFPVLAQPFTVQTLGGWPDAYASIIEDVWQNKIEPGLDLETDRDEPRSVTGG